MNRLLRYIVINNGHIVDRLVAYGNSDTYIRLPLMACFLARNGVFVGPANVMYPGCMNHMPYARATMPTEIDERVLRRKFEIPDSFRLYSLDTWWHALIDRYGEKFVVYGPGGKFGSADSISCFRIEDNVFAGSIRISFPWWLQFLSTAKFTPLGEIDERRLRREYAIPNEVVLPDPVMKVRRASETLW